MPQQTAPATTARTTRLLAGGIIAGPLFLAVWLIQALTRDGFDPSRHPISLLSLGDLGWIQIANFVVTGLLVVACAVGMRRVPRPGRSSTWEPLLMGGFGVGLMVAGVFRTCTATPVVVVLLASWPDLDSVGARLVIASAIQFGFVAALATRLIRGLPAEFGSAATPALADRAVAAQGTTT